MTETVREPAVAGLFYPDAAWAVLEQIDPWLDQYASRAVMPKALIVPHAGYRFSGATAARAYSLLLPAAERIGRVLLLGPAHRVPFRGLAMHTATAFRTPLGDVPVDASAMAEIKSLPQVHVLDAAHAGEHSLEVQLPFLQRTLDDFSVVPLVVGEAGPAEVGEVLERLWGGPETLVVISTDLSHYLDYDSANRRDRTTADHILALDGAAIGPGDACGRHPTGGLLRVARSRNMRIELLDLCNSGDTGAGHDRVVGYGAFSLHDPA